MDGAVTLVRLEGHAPSVAFRARALAALRRLRARELGSAETETLWARVAAVSPLLPPDGLRLADLPDALGSARLAARGARQNPSAEGYYDWGGGLLWLSLDAGPDGGAAIVRQAVREAGGHATLLVAPNAIRAAVPVFEPEPGPLAALSARVKASFDPQRILNPGRMHEGSVAMQTSFTTAQLADPDTRRPRRSCAPACIAASAPRPARPTRCWATSSIARAAAST